MDDNPDSKLQIIYPAYINSCRTVIRGRRVNMKYAIPDPKLHEIKEALEQLKGFHIVPEPTKVYCRELDKEAYAGRIRFKNNNPDKNNCHNKDQVLVACADIINRLRAQKKPASNQQNSDPSHEGGGSKKGGKGKKGQQK